MKVKRTDRARKRSAAEKPGKIYNFDDIIFENRNREYGAYQLRKKYNSIIIRGTIVASVIGALAVIIPFLPSANPDRVISAGRSSYVPVRMQNLEPPVEKIYVPPAPPPEEVKNIQEVVKYVPPVVVDSVIPVEKMMVTTDEVLASVKNETAAPTGSGLGDDLLSGAGTGDNEEPFFQVEVMPTFKGGDFSKFREWVAKRTNYPQAAIEKKIRGTVYLTFIVEKDGSVTNVTVIKGVDPLLDEAAIKAISQSPKWTPGLQRGQPVRVRFQIPLSFIY